MSNYNKFIQWADGRKLPMTGRSELEQHHQGFMIEAMVADVLEDSAAGTFVTMFIIDLDCILYHLGHNICCLSCDEGIG